MPAIFEQRSLAKEEDARWRKQLTSLPGGTALIRRMDSKPSTKLPPIAFLCPDNSRDASASALIEHNQISRIPTPDAESRTFAFNCYSSYATATDPNPSMYTVTLACEGHRSTCGCPDFNKNGGACKHMRAALLQLDILRKTVPTAPYIHLPTSEAEALQIHNTHLVATPTTAPTYNQSLGSIATRPVARAALAVEDILGRPSQAGSKVASSEETGDLAWVETVSDVDSDCTESVATDAEEEEGGGPSEFAALEDMPTSVSRRGIDQQTIARALHDLDSVAPKLRQLSIFLEEVGAGPHVPIELCVMDLERAKSAKAALDALSAELGRIGSTEGDVPETNSSNKGEDPRDVLTTLRAVPATPTRSSSKRAREHIIAASPEKKQKRHESYSWH